ncbi:MAG: MFS transporter [Eubacteriales bacterium]
MDYKTKRKTILFISTLGAFWAPFITSSINIALPDIASDLSLGSALLNWIPSSTILAIAVFILPSGKIADTIGRRKMMLWGVIILTLSSFFCAISQSIYFLLFFRVIQGVGNAMIATSVISIVSSAFPAGERGKALGLNVASTYIGLSTGPIIGGFIINAISWRGIFMISLPFGIILTILLMQLKEDWKSEDSSAFDIKGTLLYGVGIFCTIFGFSNIVTFNWSKFILLLGFILLILFILIEKRIKNPILNINLFNNNKILLFSSLASLINYSSSYAISYLLSLYLQLVLGLDPSFSGLVLLAQPAMQALLSPLAGRLSDTIAPQVLASSGMGLITIGLLCFVFLDINTPVIFIVILLAIIGIGFALFSSPNTNAIMGSVSKEYYGIASGILGTSRTIGQSLSMSMTALIASIFLGNAALSPSTIPQFLTSLKTTFFVLSMLCLLGVFASLARGKNIVED